VGLHWFIDSRKRLIVLTVEGPITRGEIDDMLDAVIGAKALGYRKLVDARMGKLALGAVDLLAIGARVRSLHAGSVGAAAIVLPGGMPADDEPEDAPTLVARLIGILASAKRPLRLFKGVGAARRWLDGLTVPVARGTPTSATGDGRPRRQAR
jgi:hypothetical protein